MNFSREIKARRATGAALRALALMGAGMTGAAFVTAPVSAQDVTGGSLSGTVTDDAGKAVPGAQVTINASSRGITRTATASSTGSFTITQLPIDNYTVTITADGFATTRSENVRPALGGTSYAFALEAETGGGDIVVTGRAVPKVDMSGTATGIVVDVQDVSNRIPVPRTIEGIQLLAPQTTSGDTAFGGVSIAGSSVAENIYYINGMNVTNFRTFVGGTTVPFDFYDQVQIKTGGYQAEFGRNTGGAVIALTRSGTNTFHGGANVYTELNSLKSTAPDTYVQNNDLDRVSRTEGNVWLSGPLIKDRLFFFGFFNPRFYSRTDTSQGLDSNGDQIDLVQTQRTIDKPFWGGKIDLNLFDGHRVEGTYFSDDQSEAFITTNIQSGELGNTTNFAGGDNYIIKYTGAFTDWLTLSGLYGKSKFNQTSAGSQDGDVSIIDGRLGNTAVIGGNPNLTIETGRDQRENFRVDADIQFSALGDHHIRAGWDFERLTAQATTSYSGGLYYRYYRTGAAGATVLGNAVAANTDYVRIRILESGGTFKSENMAFYIQDDWDVTDRLNLSLGVRNDRFKNFNAQGEAFTDLKNQWAPRLGVNYDLFGDETTKLTAFYGRYYLPVAANTNIRLAGEELFTEDYYVLGQNYSGSLSNPTLGAYLGQNVLSGGGVAQATTIRSKNLKPQFLDEFVIGGEHRFGNGWSASLTGTYRKLGAVLEDADFEYGAIEAFCDTQNINGCRPGETPAVVGSGGYILINPGEDVTVDFDLLGDGNLTELTIPAQYIGLPKAKREYYSVEFKLDKRFNGVWGGSFSYVWSRSKGNYEGGVKSDNGQDDTGLTQDFDEPGWMDGAYGFLPNHRAHTFKMYGSYAPIDNLTFGVNALVQSPRKFGCIGTYPLTDGRATTTLASSWYCDAQIAAGNVDGTVGKPINRGSVFNSDWNTRLDLTVAYKFPIQGLDGITLRADVFNVFNSKAKLDYNELGDLDNATVINPDYRKVTGYQTPRYVRLSASFAF
jgi:outer membrane receptor protein involved in Fe transport